MTDKLDYFPLPFKGEFVGDGKFKHLAPFIYHSKLVGTIEVPIGTTTDAGSIPRLLRPIIGAPWGGKYVLICIIHDYLCVVKTYSRKLTQQIFLEGLNVLGVPLWKKPLMYAGVRAWSWLTWNRYDNAD